MGYTLTCTLNRASKSTRRFGQCARDAQCQLQSQFSFYRAETRGHNYRDRPVNVKMFIRGYPAGEICQREKRAREQAEGTAY